MRRSASWICDSYTRMEYELEQWGLWHRTGTGGIAPLRGTLGRLRRTASPSPCMTDERAEEIDHAVSALERVENDRGRMHGAIVCVFRDGLSIARSASIMGVAINTLRYRLIPQGVRWIDAYLAPVDLDDPTPREAPQDDAVVHEIRSLIAETVGETPAVEDVQAIARYLRSDPVANEIRGLLRAKAQQSLAKVNFGGHDMP